MKQGFKDKLFGLRQDQKGIAATELALILPVFMVFVLGLMDFGSAVHYNMQVQTAAHTGGQYAIAKGFNANGITNAVLNATSASGITLASTPTQFCGCATATGVTTLTCGNSCPDGSMAGTYVSVTARGTYQTYFPYPVLASQYVFTEQATVRIQ